MEDLFVVGIGSSAGGVTAMRDMLQHASCHKSMCFVVTSHMSRYSKSDLREILSRATNLDSVTITDGMKLERCKLYIIPENKHVTLSNGILSLHPRPEGPNNSVDVFFESLAKDAGSRAIGIILSGALVGRDGEKGITAIKRAGGHTYAQSPETAQFPSMPEIAINTGCVDSVMDPVAIGHELALVSLAHA